MKISYANYFDLTKLYFDLTQLLDWIRDKLIYIIYKSKIPIKNWALRLNKQKILLYYIYSVSCDLIIGMDTKAPLFKYLMFEIKASNIESSYALPKELCNRISNEKYVNDP